MSAPLQFLPGLSIIPSQLHILLKTKQSTYLVTLQLPVYSWVWGSFCRERRIQERPQPWRKLALPPPEPINCQYLSAQSGVYEVLPPPWCSFLTCTGKHSICTFLSSWASAGPVVMRLTSLCESPPSLWLLPPFCSLVTVFPEPCRKEW